MYKFNLPFSPSFRPFLPALLLNSNGICLYLCEGLPLYAAKSYNLQIYLAINKAQNGSLINQYDFSYDAAGNITGEQVNPEPLPYMTDDAALGYTTGNRLQNVNEQGITYDADGNMVTGLLEGKKASFAFDSRNRLVQAGNANYAYDAENNRIGVTSNGASTTYIIDPNSILSEILLNLVAGEVLKLVAANSMEQ